MRLRLLAACAAVLVFAGLAPAQRFDAYTTSAGGQAGQWVPGNTLFYPAVKVGGVLEHLPTGPVAGQDAEQAAGNFGFAWCLSADARVAGGYLYTPAGTRHAVVWYHDDEFGWSVHRTGVLAPAMGAFFAYPTVVHPDGTAAVGGVSYSGRPVQATWLPDGSIR